MNKYYLTFEAIGQLFSGGWVLVFASDELAAKRKFVNRYGKRAFDPLRHLNFALIFPGPVFERSPMYKFGIGGKFCQDVIF